MRNVAPRLKVIKKGSRVIHRKEKVAGTVESFYPGTNTVVVRWDDGEYSSVFHSQIYPLAHHKAEAKRLPNPASLKERWIRIHEKDYAEDYIERHGKEAYIDLLEAIAQQMKDAGMAARKNKPVRKKVCGPRSRRNVPSGAVDMHYRVLRIEAIKTPGHICDAKCKKYAHRYFHNFKSGPRMYGLSDGSLLIK